MIITFDLFTILSVLTFDGVLCIPHFFASILIHMFHSCLIKEKTEDRKRGLFNAMQKLVELCFTVIDIFSFSEYFFIILLFSFFIFFISLFSSTSLRTNGKTFRWQIER